MTALHIQCSELKNDWLSVKNAFPRFPVSRFSTRSLVACFSVSPF